MRIGDEQRERMRLMRTHVRQRNVYGWAGKMLLDVANVRKRQRIEAFRILPDKLLEVPGSSLPTQRQSAGTKGWFRRLSST